MKIIGLDLAWGERRPDGVCCIDVSRIGARVVSIGLTRGDDELMAWVCAHVGRGPAAIFADAPVVCPNPTGMRPVDRRMHVEFGRYKAGAYPANAEKCRRPLRVAARLGALGFAPGWGGRRYLAEVFPHPALVRWFGLRERIRYKKGRVAERCRAFRGLQGRLRALLASAFPELDVGADAGARLDAPWTKDIEDQTDALICALIGLWHHRAQGRRTEVFGDTTSGFIVIPSVVSATVPDASPGP